MLKLYKGAIVIVVALLFNKTLKFLEPYFYGSQVLPAQTPEIAVFKSDFFEKNAGNEKLFLSILGEYIDMNFR